MDLKSYLQSLPVRDPYAHAAGALGVARNTIRRYCVRERVPVPGMVDAIAAWSRGAVGPEDFFPEAAAYVERRRKRLMRGR